MKRHEERCTMNPQRICGVCGLLEEAQEPMKALRAVLPNPNVFVDANDPEGWVLGGPEWEAAIGTALERLREISHNCPACILAALRQQGIPVPAVKDFDFTAEMKAVWGEVNKQNQEHVYYG
jgi:hypothetical protein